MYSNVYICIIFVPLLYKTQKVPHDRYYEKEEIKCYINHYLMIVVAGDGDDRELTLTAPIIPAIGNRP